MNFATLREIYNMKFSILLAALAFVMAIAVKKICTALQIDRQGRPIFPHSEIPLTGKK